MKRSLQLGVLVGILAMTFWGLDSREAQAMGDCAYLTGKGCKPAGSTQECRGDYDIYCGCYYIGSCSCTTNQKWVCSW
jgi:hypothetical protein